MVNPGPAEVARPHRLSLERIAHAATVIDPVFLDSPQFRADTLEGRAGCRLVVKVETLNPIRSFKGRGTEYFSATLDERPHLVCATAGNFGQGMAYSARRRGLEVTVFAARTANPMKVERMRALGADVRLLGEDPDAAWEGARAFAAETGARMVEDGRGARAGWRSTGPRGPSPTGSRSPRPSPKRSRNSRASWTISCWSKSAR